MEGILIVFTLKTGQNKTKSSAFAKTLYGQDTSSHHGKYNYRRHGFLDDIPHRRLIRGVIIVQTIHHKLISEFLEQHSAHFHSRVVKLTKEDCKVLQVSIE